MRIAGAGMRAGAGKWPNAETGEDQGSRDNTEYRALLLYNGKWVINHYWTSTPREHTCPPPSSPQQPSLRQSSHPWLPRPPLKRPASMH